MVSKNDKREARWKERLADLPPEKREKKLADLRKRAAELDAMSPEERQKAKEERQARKKEAS